MHILGMIVGGIIVVLLLDLLSNFWFYLCVFLILLVLYPILYILIARFEEWIKEKIDIKKKQWHKRKIKKRLEKNKKIIAEHNVDSDVDQELQKEFFIAKYNKDKQELIDKYGYFSKNIVIEEYDLEHEIIVFPLTEMISINKNIISFDSISTYYLPYDKTKQNCMEGDTLKHSKYYNGCYVLKIVLKENVNGAIAVYVHNTIQLNGIIDILNHIIQSTYEKQ